MKLSQSSKSAIKSAFPAHTLSDEIPKNHFGKQPFIFGSVFGKAGEWMKGRFSMRKKNYKGRCEKRIVGKCKEVCRTFDPIQSVYADILQEDRRIAEIHCNVPLDGLEYTTDFVCVKADGDLLVRECVNRKFLTKPLTVKLLDESRQYWLRRGVTDWGLVIDEA